MYRGPGAVSCAGQRSSARRPLRWSFRLTAPLVSQPAKGEEEYLPEHFAAAPATAFEVPAPDHAADDYRENFLLMWRRPRLSIGVHGNELNTEAPELEAFDRKLQSLAHALPRVDSLLWGCSFTGEWPNRIKAGRSACL